MYDPSKLPTVEELAHLSDAELEDCIRKALIELTKTTAKAQDTFVKKAIYQAYTTERLKRKTPLNK